MRTTKKDLHIALANANDILNCKFDLNNAPHYGGWQLTVNNGSSIVKHRVPAKEMLAYLEGMTDGFMFLNSADV